MNLSNDAQEALKQSKSLAERFESSTITPEHLFLALLENEDSNAYQILSEIPINIDTLRESIENILSTQRVLVKKVATISTDVNNILKKSDELRVELGKDEVDTEHILWSILNSKNGISLNFNQVEGLTNRISNKIKGEKDDDGDFDLSGAENEKEPDDSATTKPKQKAKLIEQFGIDLTKKAAEGKLDPVIGREKELKRMTQILSRRNKNNPILVGEAGVGKTALAEGMAQRIISDPNISDTLKGKRIFTLDMASIVAGTKYRGEFEQRMKSIIKEIEESNIILFIDELHTIMGAGSAQGSLDASNMLKPALSRGTFQCIGSTTLEEYRKYIEKDKALDRRFQKIMVEPTTSDETIQILQNIKGRYEDYHMVEYTDDAISACVKLTEKYMNDRFLPDKAIDALDEAGAKVHVDNSKSPKEIQILQEKIQKAEEKKTALVKEQKFEKAASARDEERNLKEQLEKLKGNWKQQQDKNRTKVTAEDIAEVVSLMTRIPLDAVDTEETNKLRFLGDKVKNIVIGQDEAIEKVVRSIKRSRLGIKDPKKPIGTFMLLGPTGVGKTYLAKVLAKELFGSEDALIRIDMSEYMEKHTVSKLIGAPPGYVGYEDGGELTEAVRRRPYSIVLLDEIEKAHEDVFNILLQVLDDGILTDNYGRKANFKNTIVMMTSNTGSRQLKDFGTGMGFVTKNSESKLQEQKNAIIDKELRKKFAPEFLNRVDEIIMFNSLTRENIHTIIDLEIANTLKRMGEIGYTVNISDSLRDYLCKEGWSEEYGARPLKRAIQRNIEDVLTDAILDGKLIVGDKAVIEYEDNIVKVRKIGGKELPPFSGGNEKALIA